MCDGALQIIKNGLIAAVKNNNVGLTKLYLAHGAQPVTSAEDCAFFVGVRCGRIDVVRLMIDSGADINTTTTVGAH